MKRNVICMIMAAAVLFSCCACGEQKHFEETLPEVIAALRAEGQLEAPAYEFLPQYDPVGLNDERIKAMVFESVSYKGAKTKVFAYFGIPENASAESKVPGVVLVHGGGGTAFPEWVQQWVNAGYAAIAFDTEGRVNVNGSSAWDAQSTVVEEVPGGPSNDNLATSFREINEQWIYFAVSAAMKANSFLRRDPRIDADKVGITGISWGGVITSLAMGADERFCFAVPVYCNGYFTEGNMQTLMNGYYSNEKTAALWEPANYYDRVKAKVLFLNSDHDYSHAMIGTNAAHHKIAGSYQTILPSLVHGHIQAWEVTETLAFADACVGKTGQKLVRIVSQNIVDGQIKITFENENTVNIVRAELYAIKGAYEMDTETASGWICGLKEDFIKVAEQTLIAGNEISIAVPEDISYCYVNLISEEEYASSSNMLKTVNSL